MKTIWPKIALLLLCCGAVAFELWHFRSGPTSVHQHPSLAAAKTVPPFVLMRPSEVIPIARFFAGPEAKIESWEPSMGDINDVDANLGQIPRLSSEYPEMFRHIDTATPYFRQYGAVVINGRKSFVVNAFCPSAEDESGLWRKHLKVANDGGKCHWKALFDVSTHKFTQLAVNGLA